MKSRWNDEDARRAVETRKDGVSEALALRTYSARLLGADPCLVLHGGGNTSVKAQATTIFGETVEVLHVKGSGWDLATIEPAGHPAVRMRACEALLKLPAMTDEQMVNELRLALLDAAAPTPSVETLLHAALPATYIDHTHADALLAIVDQKNARAICEEVYGAELLYIPYVMPGFGLARACKEAWDGAVREGRTPAVMVLERHGVFTFGTTAKESYEHMIDAVCRAETYAARFKKPVASTPAEAPRPAVAQLISSLRGALHRAGAGRQIITLSTSERVLRFLARPDLRDVVTRGCATPDHVIRTKPWPMVLQLGDDVDAALQTFGSTYDTYFETSVAARNTPKKKLDSFPRVVLVPGAGILTIGKTRKDADIAADVYEHTITVIERAMEVGSYAPVGILDLFDVEYWSLEQAKLKAATELPLARKVALVTGAASGIGRATWEHFLELGAHVVACDRGEMLSKVAEEIGRKSQVVVVSCDVTKPGDVARAFEVAACTFGGVDIVVSNAGGASEGKLETEAGDDALRASLELNLLSHVTVSRMATDYFRRQGFGGSLLYNASKSAFNQGPSFGPYAVPKAALVSLMRQYAVDLARDGIRANAVNADRIRTAIFSAKMVESRANARGLSVDEYFRANLLAREVTGRDVAEAFAWLAQAKSTTGCVVTVDGGNAAAFPR